MILYDIRVPSCMVRQWKRQKKLELKLELCKIKTKHMEAQYLPSKNPIYKPPMGPKRDQAEEEA